VEFFIREGGCLDLSTRAVGLYSIFTAPYFLLTVTIATFKDGIPPTSEVHNFLISKIPS
jgi:hypothetical protein